MVTKIVLKRHWEGHKGSAMLRSPTTKRWTSAYEQPKYHRVTHASTYSKGNAPLKGCIGLLSILNSMHNSATDRWWARLQSKTPLARKPALMTTVSSSLRCESAAEYHTAEQSSKVAGQSSKKISEGATDYEIPARTFSWYQAYELQHWKQSEGASQRSSQHQMLLPV